jgi:hypothetical protein
LQIHLRRCVVNLSKRLSRFSNRFLSLNIVNV